jgi:hypothetical protein
MSAPRDVSRREEVVLAAVRDGRIPPARADHYRRTWDANAAATEALLRELCPGLPPSSDQLAAAGLSTAGAVATGDNEGLPWVSRSSRQSGPVTFAGDE